MRLVTHHQISLDDVTYVLASAEAALGLVAA
jgi:hypothetical protein